MVNLRQRATRTAIHERQGNHRRRQHRRQPAERYAHAEHFIDELSQHAVIAKEVEQEKACNRRRQHHGQRNNRVYDNLPRFAVQPLHLPCQQHADEKNDDNRCDCRMQRYP